MIKSTMFLNDVTVIDHAYIDGDGRIHGGSYLACFEVTGSVDPTESVVVDFSKIKKNIKAIVDDNLTGFDHKLWFSHRDSQGSVTFSGGPHGGVKIVTPMLEISGPADLLNDSIIGLDKESVAHVIASHVENQLAASYPDIAIRVTCHLSERFTTIDEENQIIKPFRYTHGLKNSTSYGCQNIAHGHYSFLQIIPGEGWRKDCVDCQNAIKAIHAKLDQWDDAIFVNAENIVADTDDYVVVAYTSPRGNFTAKYRKTWCKIIVFSSETTIECLVDTFANQVKYWCEVGHVDRIVMSEGLTKGAVFPGD